MTEEFFKRLGYKDSLYPVNKIGTVGPRTQISYYYFKKNLGSSWLEEEDNISFIRISCFSFSQLRLLSVAM